MFRTLSVVTVVALLCPATQAGEIAVKWKKEAGGFVNENRLPPGATLKIRVTTLDAGEKEFKVNGEKFTAKKVGDEFRAKVNNDGKLEVKAGLLPPDDANFTNTELRFGKFDQGGVARYGLTIAVTVVD